MNKKYEAKCDFKKPRTIVLKHSDILENKEYNLPRLSGTSQFIWTLLLICITVISIGCSSGEVQLSGIAEENLESFGINGQWIGVVDGMDGKPLELNYRFRAEGTRLIGLIESQLGGGPITNGKIDGNNIEFTLNAGEFIIINKGTLSGDEIHLTETIGDGEIKVVLKRVKR